MKLISCHITGFGRIEDYSYRFDSGLNVFLEDNGWGKSTFCAFIKAMFYGMEYSPRVKMLTDRKRYKPWSGREFGGSLTFMSGDNTYRVERTFGPKDKDDTFRLFDVRTGRESNDFSQNLGEELFEVDSEAFVKSIYIPQDMVETSMTDSLNAKIGDLSQAKDDMRGFDAAISRIEEAKKVYTLSSQINPGKLKRINKQIASAKEARDMLPVRTEAYVNRQSLIEEKNESLLSLKDQKSKLLELIKKRSKWDQDLALYKKSARDWQNDQEELTRLDDFFVSGIPKEETIADIREKQKRLEILNGRFEEILRTQPTRMDAMRLESLFDERELSQEKLDEFASDAERIRELRLAAEHNQMPDDEKQQLAELSYYFSKKLPDAEELEYIMERTDELSRLDGEIAAKQASVDALELEAEKIEISGKPSPVFAVFMVVFGMVTLLGAVAFYLFVEGRSGVILSSVFTAASTIFLLSAIINVIHRSRIYRDSRDEVDERLSEATEELLGTQEVRKEVLLEVQSFLDDYLVRASDSYHQMVQEIQNKAVLYAHLLEEEQKYVELNSEGTEELSARQLSLYTSLSHYAFVYGMDLYTDQNEVELVQMLKQDAATYAIYRKNEQLLREVEEERNSLENEIKEFMGRFPGGDEPVTIDDIAKNTASYNRLTEHMSVLEEEMKGLDIGDMPEDMVSYKSVEELQADQAALDEEIDDLTGQLVRDREDLLRITSELEECEEEQDRLPALLEEKAAMEEKVAIYDDAIKYLCKARDQFLGRYMGPLRAGLRKYLSLIYSDSDAEIISQNFTLDMDMGIHYSYHGTMRDASYLSAGYRDLAAFCSRLALIDALYPAEKPIAILDDPFTDLDESKVDAAISLLTNLSRDRQLIYFTCHKSRLPKKD